MDEAITCTACRVSITGADGRRLHYRSDLHRVNLKRKVTGLGPLTETELAGRIQQLQEQRKESGREKQVCELCSKKFSSRKALENHTKSKRHRDALIKMEMSLVDSDSYVGEVGDGTEFENGDVVEMDEEEIEDELERRMRDWEEKGGMFSGVFDNSWHESCAAAVRHAREKHGLFVPYEEFVKDWEGLMRYLGQKVWIGYACVSCDRGFGSCDAARRHMKDVGHCHMGDDWVEEYGEFYRWSGDGDDDGWEEVDGDEGDVDGEEVDDVGGCEIFGRLDECDGGDAVGLVVGGKVVGHRDFSRYYRQGVSKGEDVRVGVVANRSALKEVRMMGWKGVDRQVAKASRTELRRRERFQLVVGGRNYYTRKARFKQKMAVFNSGYRA